MKRVTTRITLYGFWGLFLLSIGTMGMVLGADFDYRLAVVKIIAKGDQGAEKQGTGFVVEISADWVYIITASHVVVGDLHPRIEFPTPGEPPVEVSGTTIKPENENRHGLALIKAQFSSALSRKLGALSLAENSNIPDLDPILVGGYPQAAQVFLQTKGYIAGREGQLLLIQPALGEGSSGGPVGRNGRVIGLVTATTETHAYCVRVEAIRQYLDGVGLKLTTQASPSQPSQARALTEQPQQRPQVVSPQQQRPVVATAWPPWPANAIVSQPGPDTGKDIWVTSVYSYAPSGGGPGGGLDNEELRIGGWGDEYDSLIEFSSLKDLPKSASSVSLYLFSLPVGAPVEMYLHRIVEPWSWDRKDRLWWANKPKTVEWSRTPLGPPRHNSWYRIDLTDLYNAWQSGVYPNYGIQLRPAATNNKFNKFYSSKHVGDPRLRPALVVVQ